MIFRWNRFLTFWPLLAAGGCVLLSAMIASAHGDLAQRVDWLDHELEHAPDAVQHRLERASLRRQQGHLEMALTDVATVLAVRPAWSPAMMELARVHFQQGHDAACVEAVSQCLAQDPDAADALVLRARAYARLCKNASAISDLSRALADTQLPLPDLYLERARLQAEQGDLRGAIDGLDAGMRRLGKIPSLGFTALDYVRRAGDPAAALDRLDNLKNLMSTKSYEAMRTQLLREAGHAAEREPVPVNNSESMH
jgi:tetratricopeptide (TPR) repeat protein